MTTKIHNALLSRTKELVQASVMNALEDKYWVSMTSPRFFSKETSNIDGRMLATNVDVPVFFRILIPSRNMVNWKGQAKNTNTHTHRDRTSDPKHTE